MTLFKCLIFGYMSVLFVSPLAQADELSIYLHVPFNAIDWSSPHRLANSALYNTLTFTSYAISHANVSFQCSGEAIRYTGVTGGEGDPFIAFKNPGLELMLTYRSSGTSESEKEIPENHEYMANEGRLNKITYLISHETCLRLKTYHAEYRLRGYDKILGSVVDRPRYGESAGCIAYTMSYIDLAGFLSDYMLSDWRRHLKIPKDLIGTPETKARLRLLDYAIFRKQARWAREDESHLKLDVYDPQLVYEWITKVAQSGQYYPDLIEVKSFGTNYHLIFDKRNVPTPTEPIWLHE